MIYKIKTNLIGKDEIFNYLLLAEITSLPILLIGPPGVGKTQILTDYTDSLYNGAKKFILELDWGTKISEIKGHLDLKKYVQNHEWETITPITNADIILINEVDKGSSDIRNTLLSIMKEKKLWLGDEIKNCNWKIFLGSCNEIPEDEIANPFWDRFVIKIAVNRIPIDLWSQIWESQINEIIIDTDDTALQDIIINRQIIDKYLHIVHKYLTDRTIATIPLLYRGIKKVWKLNDIDTILRVCDILTPLKKLELIDEITDRRYIKIKSILSNAMNSLDNNYIVLVLKDTLDELETLETELDPVLLHELKELFNNVYTKISK